MKDFKYWLALSDDVDDEYKTLKWWQFIAKKINREIHFHCITKAWDEYESYVSK